MHASHVTSRPHNRLDRIREIDSPCGELIVRDAATDERLQPAAETTIPYRLATFDHGLEQIAERGPLRQLPIQIEFGSTQLSQATRAELHAGILLPLQEEETGEVRLLVANHLVALGETVVVDGKLAVQITRLFGESLATIATIPPIAPSDSIPS